MLDADGFVIAGRVHDVRLHQFDSTEGVKFVIKGMVKSMHMHAWSYMYAYILVHHFVDQAFSKDASWVRHCYLGPQ